MDSKPLYQTQQDCLAIKESNVALYAAIANNDIRQLIKFCMDLHESAQEQALFFSSSEKQKACELEQSIGATNFFSMPFEKTDLNLDNFHYEQLNFVPLRSAVGRNDIELVRKLLSYGADIHYKDISGETIFHDACNNASITIVESLLAQADTLGCLKRCMNTSNNSGTTPLHYAMGNPSLAPIIEKLLQRNIDCTVKNISGDTLLHYAVYSGSVEVAKILLEHGTQENILYAMLETPNHQQQRPLRYAIAMHKEKFVALFLQYGASLDERDSRQHTLFHYGVYAGHHQIMALLLDHAKGLGILDKMLHAFNDKGETPLHYAIGFGHAEIAGLLLQNGAQVGHKDINQNTPLHYAVYYGSVEVARVLLEHGNKENTLQAMLKKARPSQQTPLHYPFKLDVNIAKLLQQYDGDNIDILAIFLRCLVVDKVCIAMDQSIVSEENVENRWPTFLK